MAHPTRKPRPRKDAARPKKPYAEFPLYPHPLGYWSKKIRGKIQHFGRWGRMVKGVVVPLDGETWRDALELFKSQVDDLQAGRTPRPKSEGGLTVADLCNHFLTAKLRKKTAGELGARMFDEYKAATDRLVAEFGKTRLVEDLAADDFGALRATLANQYGPVRLGNEIQRVRTVFRYGVEAGLIEKAVRFGGEFKKPSKRVLRKHRAASGSRMFEADELRKLIAAAGVPLRAMILLAVNAAFGNSDCGSLPLSSLDLERGWVRFPRPKTGIERRAALWPETVEALKAALQSRPKPKDEAHAGLAFITKWGRPWASGRGYADAVTLEMGKLLRKTRLAKPGRAFYSLRHTFRTVADATRDFPAVRLVMGHADDSIDDVYRERIDDDRLRAVAEYVRIWLFGPAPEGEGDPEAADGSAKGIGPEISDPCDPAHENAGKSRVTSDVAGPQESKRGRTGSQGRVASCDGAPPRNPAKTGTGPQGPQGSQESAPVLPADARPTLRLFAG